VSTGDVGPMSQPPARVVSSNGVVPERHLVVVHQPGWQAIEDWYEIAEKVARIDPRIAVIVASATVADDAVARFAASRPTLVVSAGPLGVFRPLRGKVYFGRPIHKFEQLKRLAEAGVRVPRSVMLGPDTVLDPAEWGEFVVLKPTDIGSSSQGDGIGLMRTTRVKYRAREDYPEGHPGRLGPMVVQRFIDTGPHITAYRVLTLFGRPLYCQMVRAVQPRPDLTAENAVIEAATVASQAIARDRLLVYEADVIAAAAAAYRALPEAPLQGCDIIREAGTDRVYVLEVNPGGNTWHFSSSFLAGQRAELGPQFERQRRLQLDAFGTAAQVLAERTLAEAE
jgi:hypothetical protein